MPPTTWMPWRLSWWDEMQIISEHIVMGSAAFYACCILTLFGIMALIASMIEDIGIVANIVFAVAFVFMVITVLLVIKYSDRHVEYKAVLIGTVDMDDVTSRYTIVGYKDGVWTMVPKGVEATEE